MKVYEVVLKGAVEGGYISVEKTIALFATLDDAKAFITDVANGKTKARCNFDFIDKVLAFERVVGEAYSSSTPVVSMKMGCSEDYDTLPQYDTCGIDSGLWYIAGDYGVYYENLSLGIRRDGTLVVGQYPEWDGDSYKEDGTPDAERIELGELECENPYQNTEASEKLLRWLDENERAVCTA